MAGTRYRSISRKTFAGVMSEMGFTEVRLPRTQEYVYERAITNGPRPSDRFKVRVFSSVDVYTGVTREIGSDAIRVMLFDTERQRGILDLPRVCRTENALANTKARARTAWGYVMDANHHCSCGSLMITRKGKRGEFLGCTSFPECREVRQTEKCAA